MTFGLIQFSASATFENLLCNVGRSDKDLRWDWLSLGIESALESFAPIISNSVGEKFAIFGKAGCCKGAGELLWRLVLTFAIFVPNNDGSIASACRKCVVFLIERDGVDRIDISFCRVFLLFAMTLKAKVIIFAHRSFARIVVFDSTSAFDRAYSIAFTVSKYCNWCSG